MIRKSLLFVFVLLWAAHSRAQLNSLGEFVYTVPLKKYNHVNEVSTQWWHEYFEYNANENFFSELIKRIDSGKIQVMEPVYPFKQAMTRSDANLILHRPDSIANMDVNTGELIMVIVINDFTTDRITSVTFLEEWSMDGKTLRFEKKVKGFTVNADKIDRQTGELSGIQPLFFVPTDPGFNVNSDASSVSSSVKQAPPLTFDLRLEDLTPDDTTAEEKKLTGFLKAAGNSAKAHPDVLRDTAYPFTAKLPVTKDPHPIVNRLPEAKGVRFLEEWQLDINKLVFTKKVMGVLLKSDNRDLAFLPLNNYVPAEIITSSQLVVPRFSTVSYFSLPYYRTYESRLTNADSLKIRSFGVDLLTRAQKKEFALYPSEPGIWEYNPWSADCKPKDPKETDLVFTWVDTVMEMHESGLWDPMPVAKTFTREFTQLAGYRFYETWVLDLDNLRFEKNIKSLGFEFPRIDRYTGDIKTYLPLFMLQLPPANGASLEKHSYLIGRNISYPVMINQNDLGNDGFAVDYEGNIIDNIDHSVRYPFIQGIINAALWGKIQVTDPDKPGRLLTKEEVRSRIEGLKDSLFPKGDIPMEYILVNRILFNEDWYYDPATAQFHKKVNSITLSRSFPITVTQHEMMVTIMEDKKLFTLTVNTPKSGSRKK